MYVLRIFVSSTHYEPTLSTSSALLARWRDIFSFQHCSKFVWRRLLLSWRFITDIHCFWRRVTTHILFFYLYIEASRVWSFSPKLFWWHYSPQILIITFNALLKALARHFTQDLCHDWRIIATSLLWLDTSNFFIYHHISNSFWLTGPLWETVHLFVWRYCWVKV